jgi:hypothetical protein
MAQTNGETYFAHFRSEAGVTHVFFLPAILLAILLKGLGEMEKSAFAGSWGMARKPPPGGHRHGH